MQQQHALHQQQQQPAGGDDRLAVMRHVFEAGAGRGLHRQLGPLLEVAEMLGLADTPAEVAQVNPGFEFVLEFVSS